MKRFVQRNTMNYSRWDPRSGAHVNPAFTLAFHVLGKIDAADGLFYVLAQFIRDPAAHRPVHALGNASAPPLHGSGDCDRPLEPGDRLVASTRAGLRVPEAQPA
jgi:hypothetical protein